MLALGWGIAHSRRAGANTEEFFAAGRRLPWWIAGTSIVATTFAADTPLAISGLVISSGVSANWFWWADVLPAMIAAFVVAHLWVRSGVLTDNELIELRYGGRSAAGLRIFRALYFGVLRNAIVLSWVNLAMLKVVQLSFGLDESASYGILTGLFVLTVVYTLLSGLLGVVLTDLLQFGMAMLGAIMLAYVAVDSVGGLSELVQRIDNPERLWMIPQESEAFWAFIIYVFVKSWSSGNTEGNGYIAQRLLATPNESEARKAAIWFAIANFALRPWPWIIVGLVALVSYPTLDDPETGYIRVLLDQLPSGMRGLMIATFLAAFMSTVDTQLNWGSSYLTHDLYRRFIKPGASERELVRVARLSVVVLAMIGALATLGMSSIADAWKLFASISAGIGLIGLLRWTWWRINAWSEISVMISSLLLTNLLSYFPSIHFPFSLAIVVMISVPISLLVTMLTQPEDSKTLQRFYQRISPPGLWSPVADSLGETATALGIKPWLAVLCATLGVYGLIYGTGELLLARAWIGASAILVSLLALGLAIRIAISRPRATQHQRSTSPPA